MAYGLPTEVTGQKKCPIDETLTNFLMGYEEALKEAKAQMLESSLNAIFDDLNAFVFGLGVFVLSNLLNLLD